MQDDITYYEYDYDSKGKILEKRELNSSRGLRYLYKYVYNTMNCLISESCYMGDLLVNEIIYEYNDFRKVTSKKEYLFSDLIYAYEYNYNSKGNLKSEKLTADDGYTKSYCIEYTTE